MVSQNPRIRDLGYKPGQEWLYPGPQNAITDVPGVQVGTFTLREGEYNPEKPEDRIVRTGVTIVQPRKDEGIWTHPVYARILALNGTGEMSNSHLIKEQGWLQTPIAITDTVHVGAVNEGVLRHLLKTKEKDDEGRVRAPFYLPCVAETSDNFSTPYVFALRPEHVSKAVEDIDEPASRSGPDLRPANEYEGSRGGGTGMCCLGHKGGNGTSSRLLPKADGGHYTLGCFVQANFGAARDLTIGGVLVGRKLALEGWYGKDKQDAEKRAQDGLATDTPIGNEGSIIVILGTDAPFVPYQLERLLRRVPIGLARVGAASHNYSGDISLAFSTQQTVPFNSPEVGLKPSTGSASSRFSSENKVGPLGLPKVQATEISSIDDASMNMFFYAAADVVEEAVLNALCAGTDTVGYNGTLWKGLPHERVREILQEGK